MPLHLKENGLCFRMKGKKHYFMIDFTTSRETEKRRSYSHCPALAPRESLKLTYQHLLPPRTPVGLTLDFKIQAKDEGKTYELE